MTPTYRCVALAAWLACLPALAQTQGNDSLAEATRRAIESNPEVTARVNSVRASIDAIDVVRGGRLPKVDAEATVGRTDDRISTRTPQSASLDRNGVALTITQLLWDGNLLSQQISRLDFDRQARWFELLDTTEQTALEVVRAYIDVMRMRKLVDLAEDSYVQHKYVFQQIQSRVRAGVGRGVDLEQAAARLALSESNLTTETANLHDVVARYMRLVGEAPSQRPGRPAALGAGLPVSSQQAMMMALRNNPAISATIATLRSARAQGKERESAFLPRVEAKVRAGSGRNFDGVPDQKHDVNAEITLNWNLFNGGSDQARVRQQAHLMNQAADLRDKACRDARQTAAIAFNDVGKLTELMTALDRNVLAIEKARDAYRQQFEIGQRSLLDLLNAENELYTARRAFANADHDKLLAQGRMLAAMNELTSRLGLRAPMLAGDAGIDNWNTADDLPTRCPVVMAEVLTTPRGELDARAQRMLQSAPQPAAPAPAAPRQ